MESDIRVLARIRGLSPHAVGTTAYQIAIIRGRDARKLIARIHGESIAARSGLGSLRDAMPPPPPLKPSTLASDSYPAGIPRPSTTGSKRPRVHIEDGRASPICPAAEFMARMGSACIDDNDDIDEPFFVLRSSNFPNPKPTYSTRPIGSNAPNFIHAPPSFHNVAFPTELPSLDIFSSAQLNMSRYGLPKNLMPVRVRHQIGRFYVWCTAPINTDRSEAYTYAVQTTTIDKVIDQIQQPLGFFRNILDIPESDISLDLLAHPDKIAKFVAYLIGRGAGRDQVVKHIGLARKIADFLRSGTAEDSNVAKHVAKLDKWLGTMQKQIYHEMPLPKKLVLPDGHAVRVWADAELNNAWLAVQRDLQRFGHVTHATAKLVQRACIVAFVVAHSFPPFRLDVIRNIMHPAFNDYGCQDPDCSDHYCTGNRIVINDGTIWPSLEGRKRTYPEAGMCSRRPNPQRALGAGDDEAGPSDRGASVRADETFTIHILHGKNDKRACKLAYNVSLTVPTDGLLNKLLLVHARDGHPLLTEEDGGASSSGRFFVNPSHGQRFNCSDFSNWWSNMMRQGGAVSNFGLTVFAPTKARNIFVTEFKKHQGPNSADVFEGAAAIMGNTPRQWKESYDYGLRQREADRMMDAFPHYVERLSMVRSGGWEAEDGSVDE